MKFRLLLIIAIVMLNTAYSAPVTNPIKRIIEVQIIDSTTGEALTGVQVSTEDSNKTFWSDENGKLTIEVSSLESSTISFSLVSFESRSLDLSELEENSIIYLREK
jgi:predicted type IV restriction endonuclease